MPKKSISLFSGFGGFDIGARAAGYKLVAANEYDPAIAAVYRANLGDHVRVGDVLAQDPHDYPECDLLHASPPCPNFSVANPGAVETELDIAFANKIAEFIRVLSPRHFTLENVSGYRRVKRAGKRELSESYKIIRRAISDGGYHYDATLLNAADFGVPQSRRRLIVRASRGLLRSLPAPVEWAGWYAATEDLHPTLPDSEFAPWQLKRLPQVFLESMLVSQNEMRSRIERCANEPARTVMTSGIPRAFIIGDQHSHDGGRVMMRDGDGVAFTVDTRPASKSRAFITDSLNYSSRNPNRFADEPAMTVTNYSPKHPAPLGYIGRVVKMTARALARFQSFPDDYKLPRRLTERKFRKPLDKNWRERIGREALTIAQQEHLHQYLMSNDTLACTGIGNAVPPLMAQRILESLD